MEGQQSTCTGCSHTFRAAKQASSHRVLHILLPNAASCGGGEAETDPDAAKNLFLSEPATKRNPAACSDLDASPLKL